MGALLQVLPHLHPMLGTLNSAVAKYLLAIMSFPLGP